MSKAPATAAKQQPAAMELLEISRQISEPLHILRTYLTRARYTMQDLEEDFFQMDFNPDDRGDWWKPAHEFRRSAARAEIVDDAIAHIYGAQRSLDAFEQRIEAALAAAAQEGGKAV